MFTSVVQNLESLPQSPLSLGSHHFFHISSSPPKIFPQHIANKCRGCHIHIRLLDNKIGSVSLFKNFNILRFRHVVTACIL